MMIKKGRGALRRAIELASRGVMVRRRLPKDFGSQNIWVSPESALKYWRLDMNTVVPELLEFARVHVKPGAVVWDVGANLGLFSLAAALRAGPSGRVLAIEPDQQMLKVFRRSMLEMPASAAPIQAVCAAVSDASGIVQLSVSNRGRSSNFLKGTAGASTSGGARAFVDVAAVTLDELVATTGGPDVVKIDVETAEMLVLSGGTRLLSEVRPTILVEIESANSAAATKLLKGFGYRLYDWDTRSTREAETAPFNTLAIPDERA